MRKLIFIQFILCLILSCETNDDPYQGEYINLSFEEKLTLGQPDSLSKSTIHYAREARLGPDGKIYVADAGVTKIKVYSQTGEFVNSFGKRGRGPGELTDIKGFAVTDSSVVVWDQSIQRMTVFGLDGKLRTVQNFEGLPHSMHISPMKNSYLVLHGENHNPDQVRKVRLGHTYSPDFSKRKANFLTLKDVTANIENLSPLLLGWFGSILIQNSQQFIFVPYIYNGKLYEYSKNSKGWQQTHTYEGLNKQTSYSLIEDNDKRKYDGRISAVNLSEDIQYVAHNKTMGLFKYNGYIFHFTFSDIKNKRVFGVEVYDKNVSPIGYAPIKSIPITNKENNYLNWTVEDVDKEGNFYFLQETNKGRKIRVMQIDHQDLENF